MKNSFQSFLKTPKYKTIGCFDKTIGCFSLSLKNTFLLKDWECLFFGFNQEWITKLKLPQILTKTTQQRQAQPSLQHPSKGLDSSKLEHHLVQHFIHSIVNYCESNIIISTYTKRPKKLLDRNSWFILVHIKDNFLEYPWFRIKDRVKVVLSLTCDNA